MELKGLDILLTYECTGCCAHCCYRAGPGRDQTMTAGEVEGYLSAVADQPLEGILLFGEEPFLCYDVLKGCIPLAASLAPVLVFTNGYWATDPGTARIRLSGLEEGGLHVGILFPRGRCAGGEKCSEGALRRRQDQHQGSQEAKGCDQNDPPFHWTGSSSLSGTAPPSSINTASPPGRASNRHQWQRSAGQSPSCEPHGGSFQRYVNVTITVSFWISAWVMRTTSPACLEDFVGPPPSKGNSSGWTDAGSCLQASIVAHPASPAGSSSKRQLESRSLTAATVASDAPWSQYTSSLKSRHLKNATCVVPAAVPPSRQSV